MTSPLPRIPATAVYGAAAAVSGMEKKLEELRALRKERLAHLKDTVMRVAVDVGAIGRENPLKLSDELLDCDVVDSGRHTNQEPETTSESDPLAKAFARLEQQKARRKASVKAHYETSCAASAAKERATTKRFCASLLRETLKESA